MATETELTLRLPPGRNAVFRRFIARHAGEHNGPVRERLRRIHYDTEDVSLARHGLSLCLIRQDGRWRQCLTRRGRSSRTPRTVEMPLNGPAPGLHGFAGTAIGKTLAKAVGNHAIVPRFSETLIRTVWIVGGSSGRRIRVQLDQGSLRGNGRMFAINDATFALEQQGPAEALYALALEVAARLPVEPVASDPGARGRMLYEPAQAPAPSRACRLEPESGETRSGAFRLVVRECPRHLRANVPGILDRSDPECIHQARVALRRLRSARALFLRAQTDDAWTIIDTEARWLAGRLGAVRDLDVFLDETLAGAGTNHDDITALAAAIAAKREASRGELAAALTSSRYGLFLLRLTLWLAQDGTGKTAWNGFARRALERRRRALEKPPPVAGKEKKRHILRKRAKKLRYAAEFLAFRFDRRSVRRYLAPLNDLLAVLGRMNDAAVGRALLLRLAEDTPSLAPAARTVIARLDAMESRRKPQLARARRRLRHTSAFW
ncbi:CYTH and CHAD domain-containing protein [Paludibacterium paludis]|uniref:Inorganic triphosphatase n=1 Tax=Paludibacterium paludis TaxID=1225769 RepID=A0A918P281_9NEIS|nr:CHAD domain-containing protein [Paludibacterium paludis]GGY13983.1 inorganic triphosphatase [Paludibacterium paludis]